MKPFDVQADFVAHENAARAAIAAKGEGHD